MSHERHFLSAGVLRCGFETVALMKTACHIIESRVILNIHSSSNSPHAPGSKPLDLRKCSRLINQPNPCYSNILKPFPQVLSEQNKYQSLWLLSLSHPVGREALTTWSQREVRRRGVIITSGLLS